MEHNLVAENLRDERSVSAAERNPGDRVRTKLSRTAGKQDKSTSSRETRPLLTKTSASSWLRCAASMPLLLKLGANSALECTKEDMQGDRLMSRVPRTPATKSSRSPLARGAASTLTFNIGKQRHKGEADLHKESHAAHWK